MAEIARFYVPVVEPVANGNILRQYAIEKASWVWHPALRGDEEAVLLFTNEFELASDEEFVFHVSADQRYELFLDGELVSRGPDRCDLLHWSFASYKVRLPAGRHKFEAFVWYHQSGAPYAQITHRGGFIFAAEGNLETALDTGSGGWKVAKVKTWRAGEALKGVWTATGPGYVADGREGLEPAVAPQVVLGPLQSDRWGQARAGWRLYPSRLPDLMFRPGPQKGRIRAVMEGEIERPVAEADCHSSAVAAWQALIEGRSSLEIPPRSKVCALWDLEEYYCGYSTVRLSGGAGSEVSFEWAESLFEPVREGPPREKGDRNAVVGKVFFGYGDRFIAGGPAQEFRPPWWRSGRYVRVTVSTLDEPLRIEKLGFVETRYPVENEGSFRCSDPSVEAIIPLAVRGIQMCSHETFVDCPYYEQLLYVGDSRLEMLTTYAMTRDDRLVKRCIELFDWSRWRTGFVAERYPSSPYQLSLTFSMIWILQVRDYALWRGDPDFVAERLVGVRCLLECFRGLLRQKQLLGPLPGWSFMDWVPGWDSGYPPDGEKGVSSVINLLFVNALLAASELEEAFGDRVLAERNRTLARRIGKAVIENFWCEERSLIADDLARKCFSEHAQVLALLADVLPADKRKRCLMALLSEKELARTTVYFSFYLLELLYKFAMGEALLKKFDFWKDLLAKGFKTPVEAPEPSRSDCHAWGSHPLFHMHASLAGIRPAAPGFSEVRIAPSPGGLSWLESRLPHPRGEVVTRLEFAPDGSLKGSVALPKGVSGGFFWKGRRKVLKGGAETSLKLS